MRVLIAEYRRSLRLANQMKRELEKIEKPSLRDGEDIEVISGMISDLEFAIEWMKNGRNPNAMRGADIKGAYLTDPHLLDVLPVHPFYKEISEDGSAISDNVDKDIIEDALCTLTEREKEVFIMIKAEGLTYEYTAELLGVKKSTVQTHLERAEKKIERRKEESIFLI
ncbi:sigma-70 family RNA polymerase sigma factor [Mycobacteroides abscessus]|uniref:sigma-70 family RNA polymerase sigma factor n=1 Tax=Mycobacteroides abscessus TaxID=36809 RepID=UPI0013000F4B